MLARTLVLIGAIAGLALTFGAPAMAQQKKEKAVEVAVLANKGELRSEKAKPKGLFSALFGEEVLGPSL